MGQPITLQKQVYDKNQYQKVIDTSFTQLVQPVTTPTGSTLPTVDQFFTYYNQLIL